MIHLGGRTVAWPRESFHNRFFFSPKGQGASSETLAGFHWLCWCFASRTVRTTSWNERLKSRKTMSKSKCSKRIPLENSTLLPRSTPIVFSHLLTFSPTLQKTTKTVGPLTLRSTTIQTARNPSLLIHFAISRTFFSSDPWWSPLALDQPAKALRPERRFLCWKKRRRPQLKRHVFWHISSFRFFSYKWRALLLPYSIKRDPRTQIKTIIKHISTNTKQNPHKSQVLKNLFIGLVPQFPYQKRLTFLGLVFFRDTNHKKSLKAVS